MSDLLTVVKDNALAITTLVGVFTIIGAALGFWLNFRLSRKRLESDKKNLRQQMITNNIAPMRQEWINDLRKSAANFISTSVKLNNTIHELGILINRFNPDIQDEPTPEILNTTHIIGELIFKLNELYTYINILLPFSSRDNDEYRAEKLRLCMKIICDSTKSLTLDRNSHTIHTNMANKIHKYLELHAMKLLKKEWEVTKSLKEIE
ncbi:TPA: hypothetical protein I8608_000568 [Morganella morganii]|uniref:DUF4760 domain-containing protein n=1 Tax=Morganella morganii TaxID=582 RepID=A0AAN5MCK9_MORMO|nr:hypothetical protein [Morganella morganii]